MSEAAFAQILGQIKPFTEYINLHVKGEPLLHPNLGTFLDLSAEKGFKVNITTNGTLIDKVANTLLAKPAVRQLNFSLHSFDGNQHEIAKNEYIDRILTFSSRAAAVSNMIISLRLWNLDEALLTECQRRRNLAIIHQIEEHFALADKIQGNFSETKALKLSERVYLNQDYEFTWPSLTEEEDFSKGYCFGLRNQVAILVDGTVVPCCLDGEGIIKLGNIHENTFADIVTGPRAEAIRLGFSKNQVVEELCRKCGFRKRFNKHLV
jgi:radical SAM protein with 4Fe4S-binding SPASM domain